MSDTPRTDALDRELLRERSGAVCESRLLDLARKLERDNAALLEALKAVADMTIAVEQTQETRLNDIFDIARAAIAQAESKGGGWTHKAEGK